MMDARTLRAFCRPPMGVPVIFAGVSTYADDGTPICGLLDAPSGIKLMSEGVAGIESPVPELRLPFNAFNPMPRARDTLTVDGTVYTVDTPTDEDDGGFVCYGLMTT